MGLFPAYVSVWKTKHPGNRKQPALSDVYLLNTNRISEMKPVGIGNYVAFLFSNNPDDHRDSPDYIKVSSNPADPLALITWYQDLTPASKFCTLPIFPNFIYSPTATPVDTIVAWEDIAYAYATRRDTARNVCHVVYYRDSWKRVECLVNLTRTALWLAQT